MPDPIHSPNPPPERPVGWAALDPAVVTATGPDAVRFVDNFATAAISSLAVGEGTEAFFTDVRGQVLALTTVLRTAAGVVLVAPPGLGPMLRDHLERYHIRESLTLADASADMAGFLLAGDAADEWLDRLGCPPPPHTCGAHGEHTVDGMHLRVVRMIGQGADGCWLLCDRDRAADLRAQFTALQLPPVDPADLDATRIESCFPLPVDIGEKTLPQELGRDARAISFTKGCYLGQETVARLDALGHVNRRLAAVVIDADRPPPLPAQVLFDERPVGLLTSACHSQRLGKPVGLAIIHTRGLAGGPLQIGGAAARVVAVAGQTALPHPLESRDAP